MLSPKRLSLSSTEVETLKKLSKKQKTVWYVHPKSLAKKLSHIYYKDNIVKTLGNCLTGTPAELKSCVKTVTILV